MGRYAQIVNILLLKSTEHSFLLKDGSERVIESLSLIDSVMPEVIEMRKKAVTEKLKDSTNLTRSGVPTSSINYTNSHTTNGDCNTASLSTSGVVNNSATTPAGAAVMETGAVPNHHSHSDHTMEVEEAAPLASAAPVSVEINPSKITVLRGHESEVFICAWNPKNDLLASGSGDSTARIWNAAEPHVAQNPKNQLVLKHCISRGGQEVPSNKDVTSLDWNVSALNILGKGLLSRIDILLSFGKSGTCKNVICCASLDILS